MHVSGFLIFLAIVVYWASCMGRRALKWVAILFVSGCLLPVAALLALWAVETYRANHPSDADMARQTIEGFKAAQEAAQYGKADYERLMGRPATQADLDAFSARHFPPRSATRP
jgi:hypothetical protein